MKGRSAVGIPTRGQDQSFGGSVPGGGRILLLAAVGGAAIGMVLIIGLAIALAALRSLVVMATSGI